MSDELQLSFLQCHCIWVESWKAAPNGTALSKRMMDSGKREKKKGKSKTLAHQWCACDLHQGM